MVDLIEQFESWLLFFGLGKITTDEIFFFNNKPDECEVCEALSYFVEFLNMRKNKSSCFLYPDLSQIKEDNGCSVDIPMEEKPKFFLGVGVDLC